MTVKSGHSGTTENSFSIGDGTDGYKTLYADVAGANKPGIRWNPDSLGWDFGDGYSWSPAGSGGGGGYTFTTAEYTQPESSVQISVITTAWMQSGIPIVVNSGGYYLIVSIDSPTLLTIRNLGWAGVSPGTPVPPGQLVVVAGIRGPAGPIGTDGYDAFSVTNMRYRQPDVGNIAEIYIDNVSWISGGQAIFIQTAGYYIVRSVFTDDGYITAENPGYTGNVEPGSTIYGGASVSAAGIEGAVGPVGPAGPIGPPGIPWQSLVATTDFSTTAYDFATITMNTDKSEILQIGIPIRVTDKSGVEYDTYSCMSGYTNITGINYNNFDSRGRIYFSIIADSPEYFHVELYNRASRSVSSKIAYTTTFNATGTKSLIAYNSSGIGGTISVDNLPEAGWDIYVEFYKWFMISGYSDGYAYLYGPKLSTAVGDIIGIDYGSPTRNQQKQIFIPGLCATTDGYESLINSLLGTYLQWSGPPARLVWVQMIEKSVSSNPIEINITINYLPTIYNNILMSPVATWRDPSTSMGNYLIASTLNIEFGYTIEIIETDPGSVTGPPYDSDLTVILNFVLE